MRLAWLTSSLVITVGEFILSHGQLGWNTIGGRTYSSLKEANGTAPVIYEFTTSSSQLYSLPHPDVEVLAGVPGLPEYLTVFIELVNAIFPSRYQCEGLLAASSSSAEFGFPTPAVCDFTETEVTLYLEAPLATVTTYTLTILTSLGTAGSQPHAELSILYGGQVPIDATADLSLLPSGGGITVIQPSPASARVLSMQIVRDADLTTTPGASNKLNITIQVYGRFTQDDTIDVIAFPPDIWDFGEAEEEPLTPPSTPKCQILDANQAPLAGVSRALVQTVGLPVPCTTCANTFRVKFGSTGWGSVGAATTGTILLEGFQNPTEAVNAKWIITSENKAGGLYTISFVEPLMVQGTPPGGPRGGLTDWLAERTSLTQQVTFALRPGQTAYPRREGTTTIDIIPPAAYKIAPDRMPENVEGQPALSGSWTLYTESSSPVGNKVSLQVFDATFFKDTVYYVRFWVTTPSVPTSAVAWSVAITDSTDAARPTQISSATNLRGFAVYGALSSVIFSPASFLAGDQTQLTVQFMATETVSVLDRSRVMVRAPPSWSFPRRCPGFDRVTLPECECVAENDRYLLLVFHQSNALQVGVLYRFKIDVMNPMDNGGYESKHNIWMISTQRPDGIVRQTNVYDGYNVWPSRFKSFEVVPDSRAEGTISMTIRFSVGTELRASDSIEIWAPFGFDWKPNEYFESSDSVGMSAQPFTVLSVPVVDPFAGWKVAFRPAENLEVNRLYGFRTNIQIPAETPFPNVWRILSTRSNGVDKLDELGIEGFRIQRLEDVQVIPSIIEEQSFSNIVEIRLRTTQQVTSVIANTGELLQQAIINVVAPEGFTFVCPVLNTYFANVEGASPLSEPYLCEDVRVHGGDPRRLMIKFFAQAGSTANSVLPSIDKDRLYVFAVGVINAQVHQLDRESFDWYIETGLREELQYTSSKLILINSVESGVADGFYVIKKFPVAQYASYPQYEDRRVSTQANRVSFQIQITRNFTIGSTLAITAPQGFHFERECKDGGGAFTAGGPSWVSRDNRFPALSSCAGYFNKVTLTIGEQWTARSDLTHVVYVTVANPSFMPSPNDWSFIANDETGKPQEGNTKVPGFLIQVVQDVTLSPYNPSVSRDAQVSANPVDICLTTTSELPPQGSIIVIAPQSFRFATTCAHFDSCIGAAEECLPEGSNCSGDGDNRVDITIDQGLTPGKYCLRLVVENPSSMVADDQDNLWSIESTDDRGNIIDSNMEVPGFSLVPRLDYFSLTPVSLIGLALKPIRLTFALSANLYNLNSISIAAPEGFVWESVVPAECPGFDRDGPTYSAEWLLETSDMLQDDEVLPLPRKVTCEVVSSRELLLVYRDAEAPMPAGVKFQFVVMARNAQVTPQLNWWRIEAQTLAGQEISAKMGFEIIPELDDTLVYSSNPGAGLFTQFVFSFRSVRSIPPGGLLTYQAFVSDFYFGPRLEPTDELDQETGVLNGTESGAAESSLFSAILASQYKLHEEYATCTSYGGLLEITLKETEAAEIPAGAVVAASVTGYNSDGYFAIVPLPLFPVPATTNLVWHFKTRSSDNARTIIHQKDVETFKMQGVLYVDRIEPESAEVFVRENPVSVTFRLDTELRPPASIVITCPMELIDNLPNPNFQPFFGSNFPPNTIFLRSLNVFRITTDAGGPVIPSQVNLTFAVVVANPRTSPSPSQNIWTFQTKHNETNVGCNYDVQGYKIFGRFGAAGVIASFFSPSVDNILGVYFSLGSDLPFNHLTAGSNTGSYLMIYPPLLSGFVPLELCGGEVFQLSYVEAMKPPEDGGSNRVADELPLDISNYQPLPSGTTCEVRSVDYDDTPHYYFAIRLDGGLEYKVNYAFQVGLRNADADPDAACEAQGCSWRFITVENDVVLHLDTEVQGFNLKMIEYVHIDPLDTTSASATNVVLSMRSIKFIPGGSKILVKGPVGFTFGCGGFSVVGLAPTTTCVTDPSTKNHIVFTIDTQDPKEPNTAISITFKVTNPRFTPIPNDWSLYLESPLGYIIDLTTYYPGFDITGLLPAKVTPTLPYRGQRQRIDVSFQTSTILNKADAFNEILLRAPTGYEFSDGICPDFELRIASDAETYQIENMTSTPAPSLTQMLLGNSSTGVSTTAAADKMTTTTTTTSTTTTTPAPTTTTTSTTAVPTLIPLSLNGTNGTEANDTLRGAAQVNTSTAAPQPLADVPGIISLNQSEAELLEIADQFDRGYGLEGGAGGSANVSIADHLVLPSIFPPPGTLCTRDGKNSLVIRLPNGSGLLPDSYVLSVDVFNPESEPEEPRPSDGSSSPTILPTAEETPDNNSTDGASALADPGGPGSGSGTDGSQIVDSEAGGGIQYEWMLYTLINDEAAGLVTFVDANRTVESFDVEDSDLSMFVEGSTTARRNTNLWPSIVAPLLLSLARLAV
ncbi:unnamed protein product [Vitrella brassicaformis CCMP3155]|uniref:EGF-like domain-containing protein n=5 Tax=Vitrella brassicaformis TaxID=1169539 RepID=A0A0G4ELA9_VITBC|nr:unnamed protein product [Vitrella brassicaformis CCMP3155]|eukprot:CEL97737.1 unnamed protein product [Vitrella brassicaformis CCMP3155]